MLLLTLFVAQYVVSAPPQRTQPWYESFCPSPIVQITGPDTFILGPNWSELRPCVLSRTSRFKQPLRVKIAQCSAQQYASITVLNDAIRITGADLVSAEPEFIQSNANATSLLLGVLRWGTSGLEIEGDFLPNWRIVAPFGRSAIVWTEDSDEVYSLQLAFDGVRSFWVWDESTLKPESCNQKTGSHPTPLLGIGREYVYLCAPKATSS